MRPILFQDDLCSSKSFQIPPEVTIYGLFLFFFLCSFNSVPNNVKMLHLASLFSICSLKFHFFFKYRQNEPFIVLVFNIFSAVPNSFECHQNAPFSVLVFKMFSAVSNCFKCRQNAPLSVLVFKIYLKLHIVSDTVRMHHLASLF